MIITIKGADFSSANIGTLSTYIISKSIGSGASFDIPSFVDKNSSVNWVITLNEGYTFGTYSVTMGGEVITPSVVDNVMTISIAEVTGNVRIVVATINENGEEEGGGTIINTLDTIAWGTLTYRDIFVTNNMAPNINNNSKTSVNGAYTWSDSTGETTIVPSASGNNCVPPYALSVAGSGSKQSKMCSKGTTTGVQLDQTTKLYSGANLRCTRYNKGYLGIIFGSTFAGCINSTTNGFVTHAAIIDGSTTTTKASLFIGSASSADLDGMINNPVLVNSSVFGNSKPTEVQWQEMYANYNNILINN